MTLITTRTFDLQTVHTRRLVHVLLHRQLNQSIQSNYTLLHVQSTPTCTISPLISMTLFCIFGDVNAILDLGTGLSR